MTESDVVRLDFPWHAVRERVDGKGIAVLVPRSRLTELGNVVWALEAGVIESDLPDRPGEG